MFRMFNKLVVVAIAAAALGCQSDGDGSEKAAEKSTDTAEAVEAVEADYISVQHILIGFAGSLPGKNITRTKEEARDLAHEVFKRARAGEDYDKLVEEFTDDSVPGIYKMVNFGLAADRSQSVFARDKMVQAFGDVGFPLEIGGIGLAEYDSVKSKYGWHIIKRVK